MNTWKLLSAMLLCLGMGWSLPGQAQDEVQGQGLLRQEYFVNQGPEESLLIRVNGLEAEFSSVVFDPEGEQLTAGEVAGSRLAPVFHFISPTGAQRQLDIEVLARTHTNRTRFDLEISRMTVRDSRSERLAQAYRYLAMGMRLTNDDTTAGWSVKINSLLNSAQIFDGFGMEEMRLWSMYCAAHFVQSRLGDDNTALDFTEQVLTGVGLERLRRIELAAVQLEGTALTGLRKAGNLPVPETGPDPVQSMLERAAGLASALGLQLERAWALFASGGDFAGRNMNRQALERYELALGIADSLEAGELSTLIREDMVAIHDLQGDVQASSEVLQAIETQLSRAGAVDELAENLLSQGRLLNRTFQFPLAVVVLNQALEHERNSVTRAQANLELALAHYHSGQLEPALLHAQAAVINPQSGEYRRPNPVIDVGAGLDVIADIHRANGNFSAMREVRQAQQSYLEDAGQLAAWHYQRGLDRLAEGDDAGAAERFQLSLRAAGGRLQARWRHLSLLQLCAISALQDCSDEELENAWSRLKSGGIPVDAVQALRLRAVHQLNRGEVRAAAATMDALTSEVFFYRRVLPGVLGAWFWQNRKPIYRDVVAMSIRLSRGQADGLGILQGLNSTRHLEATAGMERRPWQPDTEFDADHLRVMIARLAAPDSQENTSQLAGEINAQLSGSRREFINESAYLTTSGLEDFLDGLQPDQAVLTWHIDPEAGNALVLLAKDGVVRHYALPRAGQLATQLMVARDRLGKVDGEEFDRLMDQLGAWLLDPVIRQLPPVIWFVPSGELAGIPLDALRRDGRYLAESHQVISLLTFPSVATPGRALRPGAIQSVFLAGDPVDWSGDFLSSLSSSDELRAVTRIHVGPGLTIVQGSALLPDEFTDSRFRSADVVHLAMPGYVALGNPAGSSLELSEPGRALGRLRVGPSTILDWQLGASLVVLSDTRLGGSPMSPWDGRLGLVEDVLGAGSAAAIASFWSGHGQDSTTLIQDFHQSLHQGQSTADALTTAKRRQIRLGQDHGDWARMQLFID